MLFPIILLFLCDVSFWRLFIFPLLVKCKGSLVGIFYVLYALICLNVYFGKFVIAFIEIGEIGCMSIPKCLWMVIVVNLVIQT